MKDEKTIRKIISQCEQHILCDTDYSQMGSIKDFDFYGEINTGLITVQGLRKILLWTLNEKPKECIRIKEVGEH